MKLKTDKRKLVKQIILGAVTLFFFILFWLFLSRIFHISGENKLTIDFSSLIFYFAFLSFLSVLIATANILIDRFWVLLLAYFLSVAFFFVFFSLKILYFLGILLLFFVLILGYFRIKKEKKDRIKFSAEKIAQYALPLFLTVSILLTSLVYYFFVSAIINQKGFQISKEFFDKAVNPLEKIFPSFIPGLKKESTIEDAVYLFFVNEMEETVNKKIGKTENYEEFIPPEFSNLFQEKKPINKKEFFKALRKDPKIKKEAKKIFFSESPQVIIDGSDMIKVFKDLNLSGKESISEALYKVVNEKINPILGPYLKYFPIVFALSFYFTVRFIFLFLIWPIYFFVWILLKILIALKFVKLEREKREVEILSL